MLALQQLQAVDKRHQHLRNMRRPHTEWHAAGWTASHMWPVAGSIVMRILLGR